MHDSIAVMGNILKLSIVELYGIDVLKQLNNQ